MIKLTVHLEICQIITQYKSIEKTSATFFISSFKSPNDNTLLLVVLQKSESQAQSPDSSQTEQELLYCAEATSQTHPPRSL